MREDLARLETEKQNKKTIDIDLMSTYDILKTINDEDITVPYVIQKNLSSIEKLTDAYVKTIENGGRVFYIGAGTSGRLAFIDAAELGPTYAIKDGVIEGIMAGGLPAMKRAKEFEEDKAENGIRDLKERNFTNKDMLIGVAASGRTPYVLKALEYANSLNAITGSISCVSNAEMSKITDYPVEVVTLEEVVLGSTRMKAGTAEKLVLNMVSTAACIKLGYTYKNLLINGKETTLKGHYRLCRLIANETGLSEEEAEKYLNECDGEPKVALCMILTGLNKEECLKLLEKNHRLRQVIKEVKGE